MVPEEWVVRINIERMIADLERVSHKRAIHLESIAGLKSVLALFTQDGRIVECLCEAATIFAGVVKEDARVTIELMRRQFTNENRQAGAELMMVLHQLEHDSISPAEALIRASRVGTPHVEM